MNAPRYVSAPEELLTPQTLKTMSGLTFLTRMLNGDLPAPPISKTLGFRLVEVSEGRAVFEGRPSFDTYNPIGTVHGGWYGTLLDSCMACAVQSALPKGMGYTTLEYRVNMTRPLFEHSEPIRAVGEALHVGTRTGTSEGKLIGVESGKIYGFGTTTCLVIPL